MKTTALAPSGNSRDVLLRRRALVFPGAAAGGGERVPENVLRAFEVELAGLGHVLSSRLSAALSRLPLTELVDLRLQILGTLAARLGADRKHKPLFRSFPHGIPDDTGELWVRKVLSHFFQGREQPCLFCRRTGTTHVLSPCRHVVCDHCFDGSSYSACPVCEHHVDPGSPFFRPAPERLPPEERVTFKLLDLGGDLEAETRACLLSFCERKQGLSPDDRADLTAIVTDRKDEVLPWLPAAIPVRENVALIFGTLFQVCGPKEVLPVARLHLRTATDVLRLLAAYSGADPALQTETVHQRVPVQRGYGRWWGRLAALITGQAERNPFLPAYLPVRVRRFKVARLRRPLRRALLQILEGFGPELLTEDMLRHRSYWVWMGEFLHPHEYAHRFPNVARAFQVVRRHAPDGTPAPPFQSFYSRLESAVRQGDASRLTDLLLTRPGELARRVDHALRVAGRDRDAAERLLAAFAGKIGAFATPVLLTLRGHLPGRTEEGKLRVYWPKGGVSRPFVDSDRREPLASAAVEAASAAIEAELLRRFARQPPFETALLDLALRDIAAPFNERTASPSAVQLPRGSRIDVPPGKTARLFLHWCEPEKGGETTDVDLSVGFYDAAWNHTGVCSYYELKLKGRGGREIAVSAGDLRSAPFPEGATELVDVRRDLAREEGWRYAVMVVTAYSGMPFSLLERAFAGLMLRDDVEGHHFDPRTVELKFALQGSNGIFLPLVFDLERGRLHWLDTYAKGGLGFNNVANANNDIARLGPALIEYFESGARTSMLDLALLHAAARCRRVILRGQAGEPAKLYERGEGEEAGDFLRRLTTGEGAREVETEAFAEPVFAALHRGDLELPAGSAAYVLFREKTLPSLAASDLVT